MPEDWTMDPATGRTNSSTKYLDLVDQVENIICDGAYSLIRGNTNAVARTIVSHMAHVHGMSPEESRCGRSPENS